MHYVYPTLSKLLERRKPRSADCIFANTLREWAPIQYKLARPHLLFGLILQSKENQLKYRPPQRNPGVITIARRARQPVS